MWEHKKKRLCLHRRDNEPPRRPIQMNTVSKSAARILEQLVNMAKAQRGAATFTTTWMRNIKAQQLDRLQLAA